MPDTIEYDFQQAITLEGAVTVDVANVDPPSGPYEVEILSMRRVTKEGGKVTLRFGCVVAEDGPARGSAFEIVAGTDWTKDFNKRHITNLLVSVGANRDRLRGAFMLVPQMFVGRRAFVFVKPVPEGELDETGRPLRASKNFMTREEYLLAKKSAQLMQASAIPMQPVAPRPPVQAPVVQPAVVMQPVPVPMQPTTTTGAPVVTPPGATVQAPAPASNGAGLALVAPAAPASNLDLGGLFGPTGA